MVGRCTDINDIGFRPRHRPYTVVKYSVRSPDLRLIGDSAPRRLVDSGRTDRYGGSTAGLPGDLLGRVRKVTRIIFVGDVLILISPFIFVYLPPSLFPVSFSVVLFDQPYCAFESQPRSCEPHW